VATTLGEVSRVVSGSTPRTTEPQFWGGEIAWITPDDLSGYSEKRIARGARSITSAGYESCSTQLMPAGTVLYTSRAPIGYAAISSAPVCTNQGFKSFVPTDAVSSDYLYWVLVHATPQIRELGSGTTFPELSKKVAEGVPLPLPPLAEQRRIVAAIEEQFSRLDAAERTLERSRSLLHRLRESALADRLGAGWPGRPLGDLLLSLRNGTFVSRPASEPPGTAIFRISAVRPMRLDVADIRYAVVDDDALSGFFVQPGDLLFTRYSGNPEYVGACARVPNLAQPTLHPDKLIRAVPDTSVVDPAYLEIACSIGSTRAEIRARRKTTAGQVGIAGSQLRTVSVPVPSLEEQRRIVEKVQQQLSLIDALRAAVESAQKRSAALRRAILERAFRGELVPQDPADEPASVLLERIRAERAAELPLRKRRQ